MIEAHDDLATSKPPYKVVAALAVHGRRPLLEHTIKRLYQKNGCWKVICSGDKPEDMDLCHSLGAIWVQHPNKPLGAKWNSAFYKAKAFNPDAVLYVGSSDWVCDDWIPIMQPYVEAHGFAGVPGCSLADVAETIRVCHWSGYAGYRAERADETIGSGRMLSRWLLDAIDWQPFSPLLDNSLDRSMKDRAAAVGYNDYMVKDSRLKSLSLSTPLWINKHRFEMHWNDLPNGTQMIPSTKIFDDTWIDKNFPEVLAFQASIADKLKPLYENKPGLR